MPSFDLVSEVDMHEVTNAVDQANREANTRFDFKGTNSKFEQNETVITIDSQSEFQLNQLVEMLQLKLTKRGIDILCLSLSEPDVVGSRAKQFATIRQGIDSESCRKVVKAIKGSKIKVQGSIQGDRVRFTGKKRDDLQQVIVLCKKMELGLPLQFINFRD